VSELPMLTKASTLKGKLFLSGPFKIIWRTGAFSMDGDIKWGGGGGNGEIKGSMERTVIMVKFFPR